MDKSFRMDIRMKSQILTGKIENLTLNQYEKSNNYFSINFTINGKEITVIPSFDLIPPFILTDWVLKNISRIITLEVFERFGELYTYESLFFRSLYNFKLITD